MGHALNNTLQDVLIRWRRMQGYNALWMPGTDHAGIATQAVVERRMREEERQDPPRPRPRGAGPAHLAVEGPVRGAHPRPAARAGLQLRLGADALHARPGLRRAVRQTFFNMFRDGLIFRGKRLVNWDTQLQTAVADDEIYHEDVKGGFWTFRYPVKGSQRVHPLRDHAAGDDARRHGRGRASRAMSATSISSARR